MPDVAEVPTTRVIDVFPVQGLVTQLSPLDLSYPRGASPDMINCFVQRGVLRKRPGYIQFKEGNSAIGTAVVGLFSTQDEENNTHLFAVHPTGLAKYNTSTKQWDAMTGPALTGSSAQLFSFVNSQNSMVFSQGVDQVMRMPFTGSTYAILNANCPPARYLERFTDRLNLAYTVESGNVKPFRVRRSVAADHTNWTGAGSGFVDMSEFPHHVRGIRKIGAQMAVYTEKSILLGTRTELPLAPARYDILAADVGLYADFTLQGRKNVHYFLGADDFYALTTAGPQELRHPARDTLFLSLNPSVLRQMFAVTKLDSREYIAFLITTGGSRPDIAWVFNWGYGVWYPWSISGPLCGTSHRLDSTLTIDELVGTIDEQDWEFDSRTLSAQFDAMLTGHADGKIYIWDTQYKSDNGIAINCRWTSKDFTAADIDPRFRAHKVTLRGIGISYRDTGTSFTLTFSYSTNGGQTWTYLQTTGGSPVSKTFASSGVEGGELDDFISDLMVTGNRVRFRIEQSSAVEDFQVIAFYPVLELHESPIYAV